jgi:hypothetical protein
LQAAINNHCCHDERHPQNTRSNDVLVLAHGICPFSFWLLTPLHAVVGDFGTVQSQPEKCRQPMEMFQVNIRSLLGKPAGHRLFMVVAFR